MRLHRFFVSQIIGDQKTLTINSAELVNQVSRVFRLKIGDSIILFDGSGFDYECKIDSFGERSKIMDNKGMQATVVSKQLRASSPFHEIVLCASIIKKDHFEMVVEKATELGVSKIIPVLAERSEKKSLNKDRLKKIAIEASEQSGRGDIPEVSRIMTLEETIEEVHLPQSDGAPPTLFAFHTEGKVLKLDVMQNIKSIVIFIGPEGGWSPEEVEVFHKNDIQIVCLGSQILRAETAAIAAISQFAFNK